MPDILPDELIVPPAIVTFVPAVITEPSAASICEEVPPDLIKLVAVKLPETVVDTPIVTAEPVSVIVESAIDEPLENLANLFSVPDPAILLLNVLQSVKVK